MNFIIDLDAIIGNEGKPKGGSIDTLKALQGQGFRIIVAADPLKDRQRLVAMDNELWRIQAEPVMLTATIDGPLVVVADGEASDPPAVVVLTGGQGVDVLRRFVGGLPGVTKQQGQ